MRATAIIAMVALALAALATGAAAETLSKSTAKITQLKIAHSGNDGYGAPTGKGYPLPGPKGAPGTSPPEQPTAWGIYSNYIGPGDINRLISVDIYLDSYNRISTVKVVREAYTGDIVTSVFTDVVEFSIQTLKPGARRPYKETPITIRTADGLTFP